MNEKHKKYIDKVVTFYANRKWRDEKIKYRSKGLAAVLWEMFLDRIALLNYTLLIVLTLYIAYIYMQDTTGKKIHRVVSMEKINMTEKKNGRLKSTLVADSMVKDDFTDTVDFENINFTNYGDKKSVDTVVARRAHRFSKNRNMYFEGNVFLRSEYFKEKDGVNKKCVDRFYTQRLDYNYGGKIATTKVPVRIYKGDNIVVTGDSMWTNLRENRTKVTDNVRVIVYDEDGEE